MLTLTLDTQCLRYFDPDHESPRFVVQLTQLLDLAARGLVSVARVGTIVEKDLANGARRQEWLEKIEALPAIEDIPGVAVLHEWVLGRDVLASEEAAAVLDDPDLLPGSIDRRDRLHLHAHRARQRDIFVTGDNSILRHKATLATANIVVIDPARAVQVVEKWLADGEQRGRTCNC